MPLDGSSQPPSASLAAPDLADAGTLFHRLNNQLGISLAHAELLEAKSLDEAHRLRAAQVIKSILEAMGTAREIRARLVASVSGTLSASEWSQPSRIRPRVSPLPRSQN